jgi:Domain of unknown function (DUF4373)
MKKDAYYFSHDANAQDDPKLMLVIEQLGMEGFGIYWALVEKLRAEKDYKLPLSVIKPFANRWRTSPEKVTAVIKSYELFIFDEKFFFSMRLRKSMLQKTKLAKISASVRWKDANALRTNTERNANGMQSDAIKGKERKRKEKKIAPNAFGDFNTHDGTENGIPLDHNGNPIRKGMDGMVY